MERQPLRAYAFRYEPADSFRSGSVSVLLMTSELMTERLLRRARAGDQLAFRDLTDPFRRELQLHCYRILGSLQDAEDMLQETLLAAWRGLADFEGRASLRTWLYRIATNRCLNLLRSNSRRPAKEVPMFEPPPPTPTRSSEPLWLQPYPDVLLEGLPDSAPGPAARYELREAIALAFVAGLQRLPPLQRTALVLRDVLGFSAGESAAILETTEASVKGALQRARAALAGRQIDASRAPVPGSKQERELVGRFAEAFERGDVAAVVALLTDDAWVTMPPYPFEYQGKEAITLFLEDRARVRGAPLRLVPTRANGQPAFGCYLDDPHAPVVRPFSFVVLALDGEQISAITAFAADTSIFAQFGLPRTLPRA
jgi:RNA polymerase sigma-70 factor (TIGR02960 family)